MKKHVVAPSPIVSYSAFYNPCPAAKPKSAWGHKLIAGCSPWTLSGILSTLNEWNHLETAFCIFSGYLCGILTFVWWYFVGLKYVK